MGRTLFFGSAIETTLRDRTTSFDGHPLWASSCLISEPKILVEAYRDFLKAGVDILLTNTYQASLKGFKAHLGLDEKEGRELFKKAAFYCREAIEIEKNQGTIEKNKEILIFASLGSFGAHLADGSEYTGEYLQKYDIEYIKTFQKEQIQLRSDAGVDGLFLATIPTSQEAFMMAELLKEFPHLKALLTFSCKDESHLCNGEKFDEIAKKCWLMNPSQILAIGVNCSPPNCIDNLITPLKKAEIPVCVVTLTDKIWDNDLKQWKPCETNHIFYVSKWVEMGIECIGGGCESSYQTIQKIGKIIKG